MYNYLIDLQNEMRNYSFIFLNTLSKDLIPSLNEMNDLNIIHAYPIFNIDNQSGTCPLNLKPELLNFLKGSENVQEYADKLLFRYQSFNKDTSLIYTYYAFKYIDEILDYLKPEKVILWNKFTAFNSIFDDICKKILDYNIQNEIFAYRLSSDSFPWMSEYEFKDLPKFACIETYLKLIGDKIKDNIP